MNQKRKYGDRWVDPTWGYVYVRIEDHPFFPNKKSVLEHRLLLAEKLGRPLSSSELVHHIDGNKTNNDLANLELHSRNSHAALHSEGKQWSEKSKQKASISAIERNSRPEHKALLVDRAKRQHREGKFGKATWRKERSEWKISESGKENQRANAKKLNEEGKLGPKSWKRPHTHPPTTLGSKRINNGNISKMLKPGSPMPEGFVYGSLPEFGKKISVSKEGKPNGILGKKFPNRKKSVRSIMTPDQREKLSIAHGGKPWSEEKKAVEWVYFHRRIAYNKANGLSVPKGY